jgi:hypothetical protein
MTEGTDARHITGRANYGGGGSGSGVSSFWDAGSKDADVCAAKGRSPNAFDGSKRQGYDVGRVTGRH